MEADRAEEWTRLLLEESEKREQSDRIDDWFHTIIYCVSAKGARIEDFEIESIVRPLVERGHCVAFVLTKCDIASREEIDGIRAVIDRDVAGHGGIVEVGSVSQILRGNRQTAAFGRESAFALIGENFAENLQRKVRSQLLRRAKRECEKWKREALAHFVEEAGIFTPYKTALDKVNLRAQHRFEKLINDLDAWYSQRNREARLMLSRFQAGMLEIDPKREHPVSGRRDLLGRDEFAWGGADVFTNIVMNMIPGVNVLYAVVGKDMHKDLLAEKLDGVVFKLLERLSSWQSECSAREVA